MPRTPVPNSSEYPYHITARCINREWFNLPMPVVWSIMEDYLYLVADLYSLRIHSFVLMSNHFHLIVSAPLGNISAAMNYFMRETSREISRLSERINQTYGGRHHKTLLISGHYYMNTYKYVYRNPVRANICERVEDYPYSTLSGKLGLTKLIVPVIEDTLLAEDSLVWLNTPPKKEHEEEMRKALRRPIFKFVPPKSSNRPSELEILLL